MDHPEFDRIRAASVASSKKNARRSLDLEEPRERSGETIGNLVREARVILVHAGAVFLFRSDTLAATVLSKGRKPQTFDLCAIDGHRRRGFGQ